MGWDANGDCDGIQAAMTARDRGSGVGTMRRLPTRMRGYETKIGGGGTFVLGPRGQAGASASSRRTLPSPSRLSA